MTRKFKSGKAKTERITNGLSTKSASQTLPELSVRTPERNERKGFVIDMLYR